MRSDLIKKALKNKKESRCTVLKDAYQPLNNICTTNAEHLLTDHVSLPILEDEDHKGAIVEQLFPKSFNGTVTILSERVIPVEKNAVNLYPKIFIISGEDSFTRIDNIYDTRPSYGRKINWFADDENKDPFAIKLIDSIQIDCKRRNIMTRFGRFLWKKCRSMF